MRKKILLLGALAAVAGSFAAAPPAAKALLTCPEHPPGYCCSGPPLCRCTPGPCI